MPGIVLNLTLTPEQIRQLGGDPRNLHFSVSLGGGGVTINNNGGGDAYFQPQPVHRPPPIEERKRTVEVQPRGYAQSSGTIQGHYYSLIRRGALLQQSDWRLGQRGLLIPQGGLCATTSAVNVIHAAFSHLGHDTRVFTSTSDHIVARLVTHAWQRLGADARMGINFDNLETVINEVANELHPDVGVKADKPNGWRTQRGIDFAKIRGDDDTLALLCVKTSDHDAHAIVLLHADAQRQVLQYSDPNRPNQISETRFRHATDGSIFLDSFPGHGLLTDVLQIRTKSYDRMGYRRWRPYEGKRVHIIDQEGRRYLTSIAQVEGPTKDYPSGRVIQYTSCMGSQSGGTWPIDSVSDIEVVDPPSKKTIDGYEKYVGKKVRVIFSEPGYDRQHGDKVFEVLGLERKVDGDQYPYGALKLKDASTSWGIDGLIPFEMIAELQVVDTPKKTRKVV